MGRGEWVPADGHDVLAAAGREVLDDDPQVERDGIRRVERGNVGVCQLPHALDLVLGAARERRVHVQDLHGVVAPVCVPRVPHRAIRPV